MPNWLDPDVVTYTRLLQQAGYAVDHYGKWHLGHGEGAPEPFAYGIDECRVNAGNGPQLGFPLVYRQPEQTGTRTKSSEIIVGETMDFIARPQDEPFFVNVWLNDTHAILDPDEKQLERYVKYMPIGLEGKHVGANPSTSRSSPRPTSRSDRTPILGRGHEYHGITAPGKLFSPRLYAILKVRK